MNEYKLNRMNRDVIHKSFYSPFVTALLGPRRVGKTTAVEEFARQNVDKTWVFLNMDKMETRRQMERGELRSYIEENAAQKIGTGSKLWVGIDEAQKCPEIFEQIKLIYDEFKDQDVIKFIITGSGMLHLHKLSAETLAGRIEIHHLRSFGLREAAALITGSETVENSILETIFAEQEAIEIEQRVEQLSHLRLRFAETLPTLLVWGGLPEVLLLTAENDRLAYIANYLQTYFEKDVRAIKTITDLGLYRRLIDVAAQQTGNLRKDERLIEALGCNRDTLKKYRGFLEATLLYQDIYPFIDSLLKRLVKSPKGYLLDNGLISYLLDITDINVLEKTGLIGARFENWFLNELHITLDRNPRHTNIYFWRTTNGAEVDFAVQRGSKIFPFEVTYANKPNRKKIRNLTTFMQAENVAIGFYIYNGQYYYDAERKIHFIPAWVIG